MKLMIASDIHGSEECCREMLNRYSLEKADKLVLLGDLLYHGPRNGLFEGYNPTAVIEMLNGAAEHILTIRGNCDSEVDQFVLKFPMLAEFGFISVDGVNMYLAHGHKDAPKMNSGDVLLNGHTHIYKGEKRDNYHYINVGSVTLPKNGNPKTYVIYDSGKFTFKTLSGDFLMEQYSVR